MSEFPPEAPLLHPTTEGAVQAAFQSLLRAAKQLPGGSAQAIETISSGVLNLDDGVSTAIRVDTEAAASTDNLDRISLTNTYDGQFFLFYAFDTGRTVIVKHGLGGSGQLLTADGADASLDDTEKCILFQRRGSDLREVFRNFIKPPTTQTFTSGSGTYNRPTGCKWIRVTLQGGGGGGAGSGIAGGAIGSVGGTTTFGGLSASGGTGGTINGTSAPGGTGSGGAKNIAGQGGGNSLGLNNFPGGRGGSSLLGNGGEGGNNGPGAGNPGSGFGGGGGGGGMNVGGVIGGGGGGGGAVEAIITNPAATFAYAVGSAGLGGVAGTSGAAGAVGASGVIFVEEHYA